MRCVGRKIRLTTVLRQLFVALTLLISKPGIGGDYLYSGTALNMGQRISSASGYYSLVMQDDGNLVMYRNDGTVRYRFASHGWFAVMQSDGNFVEYNGMMAPIWSTNTWGHPGALLHIQDDGNLVVYGPDWKPLWNIGGEPGPSDPRLGADVVGRDLDYPVGGFLGHLGLSDGSNGVLQAVNNYYNTVQQVSLNTFKSTTHNFWGTASPNIPAGITKIGCYRDSCISSVYYEQLEMRMAIVRVAWAAWQIGATYTITAQWQPYSPGSFFAPPVRGIFRCDTFILFTMSAPQPYVSGTPTQLAWRTFISNFAYHDDKTPALVFSRLGAYR